MVARRAVEEDEPLFTDARDLDLARTGEAMLRYASRARARPRRAGCCRCRDGAVRGRDRPRPDRAARGRAPPRNGPSERTAGCSDRRSEALENRGEDVGRNSGRRTERELAGPAPSDVGDEAAALVELVEGALGVGQESAPCFGQLDAASGSDEHRRPELALEALEPCGERRLGDEERLGGTADAAAPCGLDEAWICASSTSRY